MTSRICRFLEVLGNEKIIEFLSRKQISKEVFLLSNLPYYDVRMKDIILFQIRNRSFFSLSAIYTQMILFLFCTFLLFGNFFRFMPLPSFSSHFSVIEMLLYLISCPLYCMRFRKSQLLIIGIAMSTIYGSFLQGVDLTSILYSCKLGAMIASGIVIGEALFTTYAMRIESVITFFIKLFALIAIFSFVILIFFPKAHLFFGLLEKYGIHFTGDPHQRRLISPFFDPNYYAAIGCFPLILSWIQKKWVFFFLFLMSVFLTFSRSGIATCVFLLIIMCISKLLAGKRARLHLKHVLLYCFLISLFCMLMVTYREELFYFLHRFIHLFEDESALARLDTFQAGLSFFWEHPLFGVGYHYLSLPFFEGFHRLAPDSSLILTLVDFGAIPCLLMGGFFVIWTILHFTSMTGPLRSLFSWLFIYLLVCILFTCQFNNLLYYQFWLIPLIAILTYIQKVSNAMRIGA